MRINVYSYMCAYVCKTASSIITRHLHAKHVIPLSMESLKTFQDQHISAVFTNQKPCLYDMLTLCPIPERFDVL